MLIGGTRGLAAAATLAVVAAALAVAGAGRAAESSAPPSARNVVTDTYHGVQVSDPYRWLTGLSRLARKALSSASENTRALGFFLQAEATRQQ